MPKTLKIGQKCNNCHIQEKKENLSSRIKDKLNRHIRTHNWDKSGKI
jgi:hypothetical protein